MKNRRQITVIISCAVVMAIAVTAVILYAVFWKNNKEDLPANGQSAEISSVVSYMDTQIFSTDTMRLLYKLDEISDAKVYAEVVKGLGFTGIVTVSDSLSSFEEYDGDLYLMIQSKEDFKAIESVQIDGIIIDTDALVLNDAEENLESLPPIAVGITASNSVENAALWLESGKINFIAPKIREDFEESADKWEEAAKNYGAALIFLHNEALDGEDLIDEYEYAFLKAGYRGGIYPFKGEINENESLTKLAEYWLSDEAAEDERLKLIEPALNTVTTYDEYLTLRLKYNPQKELIINSEAVEADGSGSLIYEVALQLGENSISIKNGDETVVIDATRKMKIIQSIYPQYDVSLDGDTVIELTAYAPAKCEVTVTVDGKTLTMIKKDSGDKNEDTVLFTASYRLPAATSEKQPLGNAVFKAISDGQSHTVIGGKIYVNGGKLIDKDELRMITVNVEKDSVSKKYGYTYNPEYRDDDPAPTQYILPKGTVDYVVDEFDKVIDGEDKSYYILSCGVMIYKSDCIIENVAEKKQNSVKTASMSVTDRYSYLEFEMSEPIAVVPKLAPVNFLKPHGDYGYLISDFNAKRVEFLFSNTVDICEIENLTDSRLFSSYEWKKVNDTQQKLVLNLKEAGKFHGFLTYFNADGNFVIRFKNTVAATKADNEYGYSLEGVRITLDAGHNGRYPYGSGADGYDKKYCEAEINLQYAKLIKKELESLGATVILTRSENNVTMSRDERVDIIRKSECDALIAIHQNGSENTSDYGTSTYYFYPYAMPLAKEINIALAKTYKEHIYVSGEKQDKCDKGCMYYPYYMTRIQEFPCVLIETGYITNEEEYNHIIGSETKELLAKAYVEGIVNYFASLA